MTAIADGELEPDLGYLFPLCILHYWQPRAHSSFLQSPLKLGQLTTLWYPNSAWVGKRKEVIGVETSRMSQKWPHVNKSCDRTQQEGALPTEGGHCKISWWTGCGSREGWTIGATNEINSLQSALMGAVIHVPPMCKICLDPFQDTQVFFLGVALGSKSWHKSCQFLEQKLLVTAQCN